MMQEDLPLTCQDMQVRGRGWGSRWQAPGRESVSLPAHFCTRSSSSSFSSFSSTRIHPLSRPPAQRTSKEFETLPQAAQLLTGALHTLTHPLLLSPAPPQRTSKEFEALGKQLNFLTGAVVRPVREPVQWAGRTAESATSSVTRATTSSIRKVRALCKRVCATQCHAVLCRVCTCVGACVRGRVFACASHACNVHPHVDVPAAACRSFFWRNGLGSTCIHTHAQACHAA